MGIKTHTGGSEEQDKYKLEGEKTTVYIESAFFRLCYAYKSPGFLIRNENCNSLGMGRGLKSVFLIVNTDSSGLITTF